MHAAFTERLDLAQVILYAFWIFFFGLIYWLRKEDRREGYPLESDNPRRVSPYVQVLLPAPKTFLLSNGHVVHAPTTARDDRELLALRTSNAAGFPLEPTGDPMLSNMGAAAYAERADVPEHTREGHDLVVPMRVATDFAVSAGADPRGWDVVATDGVVAGTVKELWVDRADVMVRYVEVELATDIAGDTGATRILPMTMMRIDGDTRKVKVAAIRAAHFASVPMLKEADRITILEEEKIQAFYAGGRLYAEPKRLGPAL
jgi:photosynthetic reaction center H subunit